MSESARRTEMADYARRMHARGWVANHDGNLSVRLEPGRYLCTPTATSKADVTSELLLVVDEGGAKISGRTKPFGEIGLHLTVYRNRPDVGAVVHAHPPTATGFGAAGLGLDEPFIAEAVVSLGPSVPLVPFALPGEAACQALAPYVAGFDAVLVAGNGVFAWGRDLEQAYLRLELVEHLARIAVTARQLGGIRPLPSAALPSLLESRRKAGLGAAAERTTPAPKTVVACAPAPPGSDVQVYDPKRNPPNLAEIIRQELAAALQSK